MAEATQKSKVTLAQIQREAQKFRLSEALSTRSNEVELPDAEAVAQSYVALDGWTEADAEQFLRAVQKEREKGGLAPWAEEKFKQYQTDKATREKAKELNMVDIPILRDLMEGGYQYIKNWQSSATRAVSGKASRGHLQDLEARKMAKRKLDKEDFVPVWLHRGITGATRSLLDMATWSALGGGVGGAAAKGARAGSVLAKGARTARAANTIARQGAGAGRMSSMIGGFSAMEGNRALAEAEEAGLTGSAKWGHVGRAAAIEGGITAAFSAMGMGGIEKAMGGALKGGTKQVSKSGAKNLLKKVGLRESEEALEENAVELTHRLNQRLNNLGPNPDQYSVAELIRDTTVQTVLATGAATSVQQGMAQRSMREHEQAIRDNAEKFGISEEDAQTAMQESQKAGERTVGGDDVKRKAAESALGRELVTRALQTREGAKQWVNSQPQENKQAVLALAEMDNPSRKDFRRLGLPEMSSRQRQVAARQVRNVLAQQQEAALGEPGQVVADEDALNQDERTALRRNLGRMAQLEDEPVIQDERGGLSFVTEQGELAITGIDRNGIHVVDQADPSSREYLLTKTTMQEKGLWPRDVGMDELAPQEETQETQEETQEIQEETQEIQEETQEIQEETQETQEETQEIQEQEVEAGAPETTEEESPQETEPSYEEWTMPQLREEAKALGVKNPGTKAKLIERLRQASTQKTQAEEEQPQEPAEEPARPAPGEKPGERQELFRKAAQQGYDPDDLRTALGDVNPNEVDIQELRNLIEPEKRQFDDIEEDTEEGEEGETDQDGYQKDLKESYEGRVADLISTDKLGVAEKTREMKKLAHEFGLNEKEVEENVEARVVDMAHDIATGSGNSQDKFDALVDLYEKQPKLSTRTGTSREQQAYSTPVPLAYAANVLAGVDADTTVYEPDAGNGMLTIAADRENVHVNEMNEDRFLRLEEGGYRAVTNEDASEYVPDQGYDRVLANPPFAQLDQPVTIEGQKNTYKTRRISHAQAANALKAMKDDGRAVFILPADRTKAGHVPRSHRYFFDFLEDNYNVAGHFEVSGDLYKKQGAQWPTRVVVVNGRKSEEQVPDQIQVADTQGVERLSSWQEVKNKVQEVQDAIQRQRENMDSGSRDVPTATPTEGESGNAAGSRDGPDSAGGTDGTTEAGGTEGGGGPGTGESTDTGTAEGGYEDGDRPSGLGDEPGPGGTTTGGTGGGQRTETDKGGGQKGGRKRKDKESGGTEQGGEESTGGPESDRGSGEDDDVGDDVTTKEQRKKRREGERVEEDEELDDLAKQLGEMANERLSSGIDPELFQIGVKFANVYIKKGYRNFRDFAMDAKERLEKMAPGSWGRVKGGLRNFWNQAADEQDQTIPDVSREEANNVITEIDNAAQERQDGQQQDERQEPEEVEEVTERESNYPALSSSLKLETLVPTQMAHATHQALTDLHEQVGDIDQYVTDEMQYSSVAEMQKGLGAEQVDGVAMILNQIKQHGAATIIGDQTGVGKGRQAGAIYDWAKLNGYTPVFLTASPGLYSALFRDFHNINRADGKNPFLMGEPSAAHVVDNQGKKLRTAMNVDAQKAMAQKIADKETTLAEEGFDGIFTTYSQFSSLNNRIYYKEQHNLLNHLCENENVIFIMDESQNATGDESNVGLFLRGGSKRIKIGDQNRWLQFDGILNKPGIKGGVYLSATYAKDPRCLPLYMKTALGKAVDDIARLPSIFARGGRAMQQAVATSLAEGQQMIRREQNFNDVNFEAKTVGKERKGEFVQQVDDIAFHFQEILRFDAEARQAMEDNPTLVPRVNHESELKKGSPFTSILWHYVRQTTLANKLDSVIDEAVNSYKNGEKPVIVLEATNEAMLQEFVKQEELEVGDRVDLDFRHVLKRALDRSLRVTRDIGGGNKERVEVSPAALGLQEQYDDLVESIMSMEHVARLPSSPIDYLKYRLQKEGISVEEITNRQLGLEYDESGAQLYSRSVPNKNKVISRFNKEELDALIFNQSAAEGVSLHASKEYAEYNPRPRHMIVAEAALNPDTFVQELGRIVRTGTMEGKPGKYARYTMPSLPVEVERRPNSMLAAKMASLNANTTADAESGIDFNSLDMNNKFGDEATAEVLHEDPDLQRVLQVQVAEDAEGTLQYNQELFREASGRVAVLSNNRQKEFFQNVEERFNQIVEHAKENGTYDLEVNKETGWEAEVIESETIKKGTDENNPFLASVIANTYRVTDKRRPPSPQDLRNEWEKNFDTSNVDEVWNAMRAKIRDTFEDVRQKANEYIGEPPPDEHSAEYAQWMRNRDRVQQQLGDAQRELSMLGNKAARPVIISGRKEGVHERGYITDVNFKAAESGSPARASLWEVEVMLESRDRRARIPVSAMMKNRITIDEDPNGHSVDNFSSTLSHEQKVNKVILTGNIISAMDVAGTGTITSFDTADGRRITGLVMPQHWGTSDLGNQDPRKQLTSGRAALQYLQNANARDATIQTTDGLLTIGVQGFVNKDNYTANIRNTRDGQYYYGDSRLRSIIGEPGGRGKWLQANFMGADLVAAVDHIIEQGGTIIAHKANISDVQDANTNSSPALASQNSGERNGNQTTSYGYPMQDSLQDAGKRIADVVSQATQTIQHQQATDAAKKTQKANKPTQAKDVIDEIKKLWGIPVRGKATFRKRALGWYNPNLAEIRLKDVRSVTVALHELGHHFDRQMNDWSRQYGLPSGIPSELSTLGRALYGDKRPPNGYKSEGFAEFIREYLTTDGENIRQTAPNLYKWFTRTYLEQNPKETRKLNKLQTKVTALMGRNSGEVVRAHWQETRRDWSPDRIAAESQNWLDDFWRDANKPLERAMESAGIDRNELDPDNDPLLKATAYSMSASGKAQTAILHETTDLAGDRTGESLRDALRPVSMQGNKELRNFWDYMVARRAVDLLNRDINPGLTREAAEDVIAEHEDETFRNTAQRVTEWTRRQLYLLVESGAMTEQEFQKIKQMNPVYVPFFRQFDKGEIRADRPEGGGNLIFRIKGSGREIKNPLHSLIMQAERVTQTAQQSDVMATLVRLYDNHQGKEGKIANLMSEVPAPQEKVNFIADKVKKQIGLIATQKLDADPDTTAAAMLGTWDEHMSVYVPADTYKGKENVISVTVNGKRRFFEVHEDLRRVVDNLNGKDYADQLLGEKLGYLSRMAVQMQRLGTTGLNAAFSVVRNPARDILTAAVNQDYARGGPLASIVGIADELTNSDIARRYHAMGVDLSGWIGQHKRGIKALARKAQASSASGKAVATAFTPIDTARSILTISEAGPRLGEFRAAYNYGLRQGMSRKSASLLASVAGKDVTVNFSRGGIYSRRANEIFLFFNAALQGWDKTIRTWVHKPGRTGLRVAGYITAINMLAYMQNRDKEWWKELPPYEKWLYQHWELPDGTRIRIPQPFEHGLIFGSLPIAFMEEQRNPGTFAEALAEVSKMTVPEMAPALLAPLIGVWKNQDWKEDPIVPHRIKQHKMPTDRYTAYTSDISIQFADFLADASGGRIAWSPAQIDHLVNNYSGGLYDGMLETMRGMADPTAMQRGKQSWPVIGTLFLRENSSRVTNDFYNRIGELKQKAGSKKATVTEIGELAVKQSLSRDLGNEWDQAKQYENDDSLSLVQKYEKKQQVYETVVERIKATNKKWNEDKYYKRGAGKLLVSATAPNADADAKQETKRLLKSLDKQELRKYLAAGMRQRGWNTQIWRNGELTAFGERLQRLQDMF